MKTAWRMGHKSELVFQTRITIYCWGISKWWKKKKMYSHMGFKKQGRSCE
ncbi:hypothetical protein [Spiroplasma endosymbiont of Lariophagus distinguendus]|nr:hypothetical protein [Spiroplasma endosymbiont of Lariophagus distinguendus]